VEFDAAHHPGNAVALTTCTGEPRWVSMTVEN